MQQQSLGIGQFHQISPSCEIGFGTHGWTPPLERLSAAAKEAGYGGALEGRSVTALEIEFGVLDSGSQKRRSHFYIREPLPYDEMGAVAAEYSDTHSDDADALQAHEHLESLKHRLKTELPDRVRFYRAEWSKDHSVVTGLDAWGRMVLDDLWADLEEETRDYSHAKQASWHQEEAWVLEQFAATQCRDFIGREEASREALDFAAAPGASPRCLVVTTGEVGSGKSSYQKALAIGEELRRRAPESTEHARGLGLNYYRMGELYRELGELQQALGFYQKAIATEENLRRRIPGNHDYACDLAVSYCRAGSLHRDLGRTQSALDFFQKAQSIGEELRRRVPDNVEYLRKLSVSYIELGRLHLALRDVEEALNFLQMALSLREELQRRAPESAEYARDLAIGYSEAGELHRARGDRQRALEYFQKSLSLREELWRKAPESADYARALGVSYERLGVLHIDLGEGQRALEFLQKSLSLREKLWQTAPDSALYASDVAVLYNSLGSL